MFCTKFRPLFNNVLCNNHTVDHNTTPITIAMISKNRQTRTLMCDVHPALLCSPPSLRLQIVNV